MLVLEDLDRAGFPDRRYGLSLVDARACVEWLASFHRTFLGDASRYSDLWEQGSYWHLATRPDELEAMADDDPLKGHAHQIDALLRGAKYKTLLHGDAKLANFNFRDGKRGGEDTGEPPVSAVDFQYTGVGVGVVDLQYLLTAFPPVDGLSQHEVALIDHYFHVLQAPSDVEEEWRALYSVAVADFQRFLAGWGGGSWRHRSGSIARHCAAAVEKCSFEDIGQAAASAI